MEFYLFNKALHTCGAALLLAGQLAALSFSATALKSADARILAFAQKATGKLDLYFTSGGLLCNLTGAFFFSRFKHVDYHTGWLMAGMGLTGLFCLIWLIFQLPLQLKQSRISLAFASGGIVDSSYLKTERLLQKIRQLQSLILLAIIALMVFKLPV